MRDFLDEAWVVAGLLAIGALIAGLIVLFADPACGPDGDSQTACADELIDDLTGGR